MHPTSLKLTALCKLAARQKWYNELNSTMVITGFDTKTGLFGGYYQSIVGEAEGWYILTGRCDIAGNAIGWTVNWQNLNLNAHSVTTWSGQLQRSVSGDVIILTTWLLTSQTTRDNNWKSTQIGSDLFFNTPQTKKSQIAGA